MIHKEIPIDTIENVPYFKQGVNKNIAMLKESIKKYGQLQPILLYKKDSEKYLLIKEEEDI